VIRYHFDLYPRTDPKNGALQVRFTGLQEAEYRSEANGTGSGRFAIRASHSDADVVLPGGSQYIRVVREDTVAVTEAVVGGFFLDQGDVTVLDDNTSHRLEFGGAGTLSVLDRAVMAPISYTGDEIQRVPDGNWAFAELFTVDTTLGAVLYRVMREALIGFRSPAVVADDREETVIGMVTLGFSRTQDSDGNAWTLSSGEFQAQVGEPVLQVVRRLMEAGLYVEMDPDTFELNAWQSASHGRDRTGLAWGTNVIRFTNPSDAVSNIGTVPNANILSQLVRGINAKLPTSHIWVGPQTDGGPYGDQRQVISVPRERFYAYESDNRDILEEIAEAQLNALNEASDIVRLRYKLGNDPANGLYKPFEHILNDDAVTVDTTGLAVWHFTDDTYPVAAQTIKLRAGGDWEAWVDLGSPYHNISARAFQAHPVERHTHPPDPALCRIGTPATTPNVLDAVGTGANGDSYLLTPSLVPSGAGGLIYHCLFQADDTLTNVNYRPTGPAGLTEAMTLIDTITHPSTEPNTPATAVAVYWRASPTQSDANGRIDITGPGGGYGHGAWVTDSTEAPSVAFAIGTGTSASVNAGAAGASDRVMVAAGYRIWSIGNASNTPNGEAALTDDWVSAWNAPAGQGDLAYYGGNAIGGATYSVDLVASHNWIAAAIWQSGSDGSEGDCPQDVGHICEVGTANRAARCDHVHAHGYLSTDGAHHHDASLTQYEPTGSITATNVQDAITQAVGSGSSSLGWYIVTDPAYGATGDGTTDDTISIQAAIDACTAAGGGIVYFPPGTYSITNTLTVVGHNVTLMGDGDASVIEAAAGASSDDMILFGDGVTPYFNGQVRTLMLSAASAKAAGAGIHFDKMFRCVVEGVTTSLQFDAIHIENSVTIKVLNSDILDTAHDGIWIDCDNGAGNDFYLSNLFLFNSVASGGQGIYVTGGDAILAENIDCILFDNGLLIQPGSGRRSEWNFFTSCAFDGSTNDGIHVGGAGNVHGLTFVNCWSGSSGAQGVYLGGGAGAVQGVQFLDGKVIDNDENGIRIDTPSTRVTIGGNLITSNSAGSSGTYHGITVAAGVTNLIVKGNHSWNGSPGSTQGYGLNFTTGATDYVVILGNDFTGNATGEVNNLAGVSGTHITYLPELSGDATEYLDGTGAWSTPAGPGGHYELLMTGASPPEPLEDGTGTDWLYVWVND
jgi:hypothetical protein